MFVVGCRPDLVVAEKTSSKHFLVLGQHFGKGELGAASLVSISGLWMDTNLTGAERASHSLFFIQIFLWNIILRYFMRANFLLVSPPSVFYTSYYFSFERVSLLYQLVDALRICTLDVG